MKRQGYTYELLYRLVCSAYKCMGLAQTLNMDVQIVNVFLEIKMNIVRTNALKILYTFFFGICREHVYYFYIHLYKPYCILH